MEEAAPLMSDEVEEDTMLTEADRAYLIAVELLLDTYPEMRLGEKLLGGERLVHGVGEVGVGEVQIQSGRGDVGVAEQALNDVDVRAPAQLARGVGVPPAVREMAPADPAPVPRAGPAWPPSSGRSVPRSARRVGPRG